MMVLMSVCYWESSSVGWRADRWDEPKDDEWGFWSVSTMAVRLAQS